MGASGKSSRQSSTLGISVVIICLGVILLMMYNSTLQLGWPFWVAIAVAVVIVLMQIRSWREYVRLLQDHRTVLEDRDALAAQLDKIHEEKVQAEEKERDAYTAEREKERASESLQGEIQGDDLESLSDSFFHIISREWELVQGLLYLREGDENRYAMRSSFAHFSIEETPDHFSLGETLTGQVIQNNEPLYLQDIPADYAIIASGLGRCAPSFLLIVPLASEDDKQLGAIELAFFSGLSSRDRELIEELCQAFEKQLIQILPSHEKEVEACES